jgi:hypothetical protein
MSASIHSPSDIVSHWVFLEQNRLMSRLNQAVEDRNRPKLQKCLARAKELNPKDSVADITKAEVLLRELLDEEGIYDNKDILFHLLKMQIGSCDLENIQKENYQYCNIYNTGITSIIIFTILEIPVL